MEKLKNDKLQKADDIKVLHEFRSVKAADLAESLHGMCKKIVREAYLNNFASKIT